MQKNKTKKSIIVAVILLLVFLYGLNKTKIFHNIIGKTFVPAETSSQSFSNRLSDAWEIILDKNQNSDSSEEERNRRLVEGEEIKILLEENNKLKETVNFLSDHDYLQAGRKNFLTTYLIGHDPIDPAIFIINKGSLEGIEVGMPVIKGAGILVGKIINVEENYAYFILITDNRSKIYAAINNENKITGIVQGKYNLSISMEMIPINKELKEGDIVVSAGSEKFIPPGLVIGKVEKVYKMDNDIFQNAELSAFTSFDDLNMVTVIK